MSAFVYVIATAAPNGRRTYVGWTTDLDQRLARHNAGKGAKFTQLHDSLIKHGAARHFTGALDQWTYEPLREADRVADLIVAKLLERFPAPAFSGGAVAPDWLD